MSYRDDILTSRFRDRTRDRTARLDEGPDEAAVTHRLHGAQASPAAPTGEEKEERLRAIGRGVAEGDACRAPALRHASEGR